MLITEGIISITIDKPGEHYSTGDGGSIVGYYGSDATYEALTVDASGGLTTIHITNPGKNFQAGDLLNFTTDGSGVGAAATVVSVTPSDGSNDVDGGTGPFNGATGTGATYTVEEDDKNIEARENSQFWGALAKHKKSTGASAPVPGGFTGPATVLGRKRAAAALKLIADGTFIVRKDAILAQFPADCERMAVLLDNAIHPPLSPLSSHHSLSQP